MTKTTTTPPLAAPAGFIAHPEVIFRCEHCCAINDGALCDRLPCLPAERNDGRWVYFTRAEVSA